MLKLAEKKPVYSILVSYACGKGQTSTPAGGMRLSTTTCLKTELQHLSIRLG